MSDSSQLLKRAAFIDELNNHLLLIKDADNETKIIIDYFKKRIESINTNS